MQVAGSKYSGWAFLTRLSMFLFFPLAMLGQFGDHLVYVRGGTSSSVFTFYSYNKYKVKGGLGYLIDPKSGYREYQVGAGAQVGNARFGCFPYAVLSKASDSWYVEPWVFPWLNYGRLDVSGFVGLYAPLSSAGRYQYFVDPATALYRFSRRLSAGGAYHYYQIRGGSAQQSAGPAVKVSTPLGGVTAEVLRVVGEPKWAVRLTLLHTF